MKRGAPMKRTAFKQKRAAAAASRAPAAIKTIARPVAWRAPVAVEFSAAAQLKTEIVRSEAYRRLVAAMPCAACGCSPCQAAHPNTGKGMAMKTDDRLCFPLCGPQPGRPGCHALFDQGAMFDKAARRAIEPAWGADTRRRILANNQWPKGLPLWSEA